MQSTSISLLDRLRGCASDDAWRSFDALYRPWLRGWLTQRQLQPADVEDVLQNVMTVLWRELPNFDHNGRAGAFRTWLRGIVFNRIREFLRQNRAVNAPADAVDRQLAELADPHSELGQRWDQEHNQYMVRRLLSIMANDFGTATVQAFQGVAIEGKPAAAVANELGMSEAAVWAAKSRVLKRLRQEAALLM